MANPKGINNNYKGRAGASEHHDRLTLKQQKFVDHYILTGKPTASAIHAGYSEKTAHSMASENLNKPKIKQAIDKAKRVTQSKEIWSRVEKLKSLQYIMSESIKSVKAGKITDSTYFINSVKIHNEMTGDNEPEKHIVEIKDMTKDEIESAIAILEE